MHDEGTWITSGIKLGLGEIKSRDSMWFGTIIIFMVWYIFWSMAFTSLFEGAEHNSSTRNLFSQRSVAHSTESKKKSIKGFTPDCS